MKLIKLSQGLLIVNARKTRKIREKSATAPSLGPPELEGAFTNRHKPNVNDIHYNVNELQRLTNQGVDVSDFTVAESTTDSGSDRGTYGDKNEWTQTDPQDGKVVIAWSVMENYPYEAETTTFMESLGNDLGCIKTVKVDRADLGSTQWSQGLMFLWDTHTSGGCWSALGQVNGYTGGSQTTISTLSDTGAPDTWQVIAMSDTCGGGTAATVHHEVLHALGVGHEHNRPDRDDYLNIYTANSEAPDQYYKIEEASWLDTGYPFELASVMTYCSFCSAASNTQPVATLKDGSTFNDGPRLTTTDALQIQNKYCKMKDASFVYKEHLMCGGTDAVGLDRPVFVDRFCDGTADCDNASDEDGSVIQCADFGEPTANGCCNTYVMDGEEFVYEGVNQGKDYFTNANPNATNKHLVFFPYYSGAKWFRVTKPVDEIVTTGSISYSGYAASSATCPPSDAVWTSGAAPRCKTGGPILTDNCVNSNCHANADCISSLDSFTCSCKTGYDGDGVNQCDALPVEDECATGNNTCDLIGGVCTDTDYSYDCSCDAGFWDKNTGNPGRQCDGCCETVDIVFKGGSSVWTTCTLNTNAVSQGGDKWVYECDNGYNLEYVNWSTKEDWFLVRWLAPNSINYVDRTTEYGSDANAEGKCFPSSLTFKTNFNAVCTSRVDDNMTTPASVTTSTQAPITSTEAPVTTSTEAPVTTSTEAPVTTSTEAPVTTSTQAPTTSTEEPVITSTQAPITSTEAPVDPVDPVDFLTSLIDKLQTVFEVTRPRPKLLAKWTLFQTKLLVQYNQMHAKGCVFKTTWSDNNVNFDVVDTCQDIEQVKNAFHNWSHEFTADCSKVVRQKERNWHNRITTRNDLLFGRTKTKLGC